MFLKEEQVKCAKCKRIMVGSSVRTLTVKVWGKVHPPRAPNSNKSHESGESSYREKGEICFTARVTKENQHCEILICFYKKVDIDMTHAITGAFHWYTSS
ncbi:hypothetical protein CEXT_592521 [Caerostris extrusa]|uniref:Uncharacterized protein n=1 Tax=Caerostris extrusa TaxID=172846 RepID=A0AAV4NCI0_CAEEX|nr:hypothetical protein CEXT_592521 [Caerostris extrusa]